VVLAEGETHLNLLPHVRASWTLRGTRPEIVTPGTNRKVTVLGALEVTTGAWVSWLGRRCAAGFVALPGMLAEMFPRAPLIVVICDHARAVTAYLKRAPRLELLYGARYSPHDYPARLPAADLLLLPQPLTGSDAGHRRALDQAPGCHQVTKRNLWNAA
jgi:hypothetical protein